MTFIRAKEIPPRSGNWYDYEVETIHEGSRVRQKVIRYIGRSGSYPLPSGRSTLELHLPQTILTSPTSHEPRIHKMKTPAKRIASAVGMYYGGMPLDAIQQQFKQDYGLDMSESNYWNWVKRFTKEAIRQAKHFKPNVGDHWVADETYMKLGKRNIYFWDIIDRDTRYLLASHVSFTRSGKDARKLMELAQQRAGKSPKVVVTDKLASYIVGIEDAFGADSQHRRGGPFSLEHSTSIIERFHRTLEQRTKVFQKYNGIEDIRLLTDGWLINYNFFKQNEGCGNIPPAQAMSKVVPFKDWNDIVRAKGMPDMDYQVALRRRESVKKGKPVFDARLMPIEVAHGESA
ncbi:MAG TPA: DDE-type integrase/transposase/recombinase [Dehalococcoidia bacterium]|nr:DDE-type integrase/transposase/recombinase [Dehalococcoidia bacterium]